MTHKVISHIKFWFHFCIFVRFSSCFFQHFVCFWSRFCFSRSWWVTEMVWWQQQQAGRIRARRLRHTEQAGCNTLTPWQVGFLPVSSGKAIWQSVPGTVFEKLGVYFLTADLQVMVINAFTSHFFAVCLAPVWSQVNQGMNNNCGGK